MGKLALLLVTATLIGGTILISQSHVTNIESNKRHAQRQHEMLAREIARSGYNEILTAARLYERNNPGATVEQVVEAINGLGVGGWKLTNYQGGQYQARLAFASPSSYAIVSKGSFAEAQHGVDGQEVQEVHLGQGTLVVPQPSTFKATFFQSMAGDCSAIYLQRMVPRDGSEGGEDGGTNVNNRYRALEPELIWASGKNRNGAEARYETVIDPGTLLNFILAVDMDCSEKGKTNLRASSNKYDYTHSALAASTSSLDEMQEGKFAMIERHKDDPGKYRIAFEDLIQFSEAQHADIKANGYGDYKWQKRGKGKDAYYSYGGSGWSQRDQWGYYKLIDRSDLPDFSDQVFQIELEAAPTV